MPLRPILQPAIAADASHRTAAETLPSQCYDVAITMARTQITLDSELQRRARRRAAELGISLAEYVRTLVARDLKAPERKAHLSAIFDLGDSGGSDVARHKDRMIGEAIASERQPRQPRTSR